MHISVCIITFKRPEWLLRLLQALQRQETGGLFSYSVVVVDNDNSESARLVVDKARSQATITIDYHVESRKNLAWLRNMAIRHSTGELVAFIDDDEFPVDGWLLQLFRTWQNFRVSGVLAPVIPHFEQDAPRWILKSGIFDRPRYKTGYVLNWNETRTGNVLFDRKIIESDTDLFDERFATHGEDRDFFKRLMSKGHKFVWCDEAVAYETQPPSRLCRRYHIRRALLRGSISYGHAPSKAPAVLKSLVAVLLYLPALPFLQLAGHHYFMKYFIKLFDHIGKLLAFCGFRVERHMKQL